MTLLQQYLQHKLLLWPRKHAGQRYVVADYHMRAVQMPVGVQLFDKPMNGPRVIIKNRRLYKNRRSFKASWPADHLIEMEYPKIYCVLGGVLKIQLANHLALCEEGTVIVIPSGIPTANGAEQPYYAEGSYCELLSVVLHPHAVQCIITHSAPELSRDIYKENYLFQNSHLAALLSCVITELRENFTLPNDVADMTFTAFCRVLQRLMDVGEYVHPGPVGRPLENVGESDDFLTALQQYVRGHINRPIPLDDVAQAMYLSRTQFARKMRQETGQSFVEYLTQYRIREAKVLLRDSEWTISAISNFLGFKTPTYFRTVFMRHTSQTPSVYRQQARCQKPFDFDCCEP